MNENYPAFFSVRLKIGNNIRPGLILDNSQITQSVGLITPEQCSSAAAELNAERHVCMCVCEWLAVISVSFKKSICPLKIGDRNPVFLTYNNRLL